MNQLISPLCRGNDVATFSGMEVDPGESLADTAAQSGIIDVRLFGKAEEALFHKFGLKPRVITGDNQAVGIGGRAIVFRKVEIPLRHGRRQRYSEVYRGRQSWSSASDTCVSAQRSRCRGRL